MINLTPHPITVRLASGRDVTFPPSGAVARVAQLPAPAVGSIDIDGEGVPVNAAPTFGAVEGLPAEGGPFLVSGLVLAHVGGRSDVFAPATGPADGAIRNAAGHIVACTRLVRS